MPHSLDVRRGKTPDVQSGDNHSRINAGTGVFAPQFKLERQIYKMIPDAKPPASVRSCAI
jgi:hypothetical protein